MSVNQESLEIEIDLDSTCWNERAPQARVYIDQILIFDEAITKPMTVRWHGNLEEGKHIIAVEMQGKTLDDTLEADDKSGILKDMLLHIQKIRFDAIDLNMIPWNKSVFYADKSNLYAPLEPVDQILDIGWNGRWELEFESPSYIWLLENIG